MDIDGTAPEPAEGGEWIPIAEAAKRANRTTKTIRRGVAAGFLVAQRSGPGERAPWLVRADTLSHYGTAATTEAEPPPLVLAADYRQREAELVDRLIDAEARAARAEAIAEHLQTRLDETRAPVEESQKRKRWWRRSR